MRRCAVVCVHSRANLRILHTGPHIAPALAQSLAAGLNAPPPGDDKFVVMCLEVLRDLLQRFGR